MCCPQDCVFQFSLVRELHSQTDSPLRLPRLQPAAQGWQSPGFATLLKEGPHSPKNFNQIPDIGVLLDRGNQMPIPTASHTLIACLWSQRSRWNWLQQKHVRRLRMEEDVYQYKIRLLLPTGRVGDKNNWWLHSVSIVLKEPSKVYSLTATIYVVHGSVVSNLGSLVHLRTDAGSSWGWLVWGSCLGRLVCVSQNFSASSRLAQAHSHGGRFPKETKRVQALFRLLLASHLLTSHWPKQMTEPSIRMGGHSKLHSKGVWIQGGDESVAFLASCPLAISNKILSN